ncbi:hypothetical protein L596_007237 [Steinernema carpocapsae]|uniref:Prefoldin subunit 2 n=1 Tax=Steinernema carpocapsae TaxID=34508 RepID=A0A4V6A5Z1_STECR|nr:hypothetical protein L596_007237 [Steinernema carpocapsae]
MTSEINDEEGQRAIVETFQKLRKDQQNMSAAISSLEAEMREYENVLAVVKTFNPDRKCHQDVAGTLVAISAGDLCQSLEKIAENQKSQIKTLEELMVTKGKEIDDYRKEHNIRFLTAEEAMAMRAANQK